jgi:hypothetical protein
MSKHNVEVQTLVNYTEQKYKRIMQQFKILLSYSLYQSIEMNSLGPYLWVSHD